jgi:hypothetical protein
MAMDESAHKGSQDAGVPVEGTSNLNTEAEKREMGMTAMEDSPL